MNVKCSICGTEDDAINMIEINTGRVQYMCWTCYKLGTSEAHCAEYARAIRIDRVKNKIKERNK